MESRNGRDLAGPAPVVRAWDVLAAVAGRGVASLSRSIGAGAGTSAPGVVIERLDPGFVQRRARTLSATTTVVSGTNGKTTTAAMLATIIEATGTRVLTNASGANLFRGIAAAFATADGDEQAAVFEVDEAALPRTVRAVQPKTLVLTNVFRDQLDRFAEPDVVVRLLHEGASALREGSTIVANADDPVLWHSVEDRGPIGFGVRSVASSATSARQESDPEICPRCGGALQYRHRTLAHLGMVRCVACGWASVPPAFLVEIADDRRVDRLKLSTAGRALELKLGGQHNAYNAAAAIAAAASLGIDPASSIDALGSFVPRFGRAERLPFGERSFWVLLAKNPVSCSTATRQIVSDPRIRAVVVMVNDRVADGGDVSWIWDAGLEELLRLHVPIIAGGVRAADVALRFRYAGGKVKTVEPDVDALLHSVRTMTQPADDIAVLATYTAMLEFRLAVLGSRHARVSDTVRDGTEPVLR